MRRLLVIFAVFALLAPASSGAERRMPGDGTLSVRDGRAVITIKASRGGVIGSFAHGQVIITDPIDGDGTGPIVSGDDWHRIRNDTTDVWGGMNVRFRLIGGSFKIRVQGRGINLSVVGKGSVTIAGFGTPDDGSYSVNSGDYTPILDTPVSFPLSG